MQHMKVVTQGRANTNVVREQFAINESTYRTYVGGPVRVVVLAREGGVALPGVGDLAFVTGGEGIGVEEDVA